MLSGDLNRKEIQKRGDICICLIDSLCLQQKLTQHCKATILQEKIFLKEKQNLKKKDKNTTSGPEDEFNHCPGYDPKATFHLAPPLPSRSVGAVLPTQEPGEMCAYNVI